MRGVLGSTKKSEDSRDCASSNLSNWLREELISASMRFARAHRYESLGTFEFLVDMNASKPKYAFIETNARLQVEHTVTEELLVLTL